MDLLPLVLLVLAAFVVVRLVQMALDPSSRQNTAPAAREVPRRRPAGAR